MSVIEHGAAVSSTRTEPDGGEANFLRHTPRKGALTGQRAFHGHLSGAGHHCFSSTRRRVQRRGAEEGRGSGQDKITMLASSTVEVSAAAPSFPGVPPPFRLPSTRMIDGIREGCGRLRRPTQSRRQSERFLIFSGQRLLSLSSFFC